MARSTGKKPFGWPATLQLVAAVAIIAVGAVYLGVHHSGHHPPAIDFASEVQPAPRGYTPDNEAGSTNGPITPAGFDRQLGAGAALAMHFQTGYDIEYINPSDSESIESTLFRFASIPDAAAFERFVLALPIGANALAPTRSTVASIPESVLLVGSHSDGQGFYLVDVFALRGDEMMIVEYANDVRPSSPPNILSTFALDQYERLPVPSPF